MFRKLRWMLTRTEYWTAIIDGRWKKFRTSKEALDAACDQVNRIGIRADVHYVWWWQGDALYKPRWVHQTRYEAQEVFEFATGMRSRPHDETVPQV